MKESKLRGTFEERKAQAIARNEKEQKERDEAHRQRMLNLTPGERAAVRRARATLGLLVGLSGIKD